MATTVDLLEIRARHKGQSEGIKDRLREADHSVTHDLQNIWPQRTLIALC